MIDYIIPEKELVKAYEQVELDRNDIKQLWRIEFNAKKPRFEDFLVRNALLGKPLLNGIEGKGNVRYFKEQLIGGGDPTIWHPYTQTFYRIHHHWHDLNQIFHTYKPTEDDQRNFAKARQTYLTFSWLDWKPGRYWHPEKRKYRIRRLKTHMLNNKRKIPLITLYKKHLELLIGEMRTHIFKKDT